MRGSRYADRFTALIDACVLGGALRRNFQRPNRRFAVSIGLPRSVSLTRQPKMAGIVQEIQS